MRLPEDDKPHFDELDEQRRRVMDEFNLLVINMRSGTTAEYDRLRVEAQHLHTRHIGILREMIDLLR
ncbi:MAG TPA: hypothetical protein VG845_09665 [Dehalococcoidia bacterium]|jgi:hypothetical protein|nr:hypothetical protein [Dehalococcoidia bacterium]